MKILTKIIFTFYCIRTYAHIKINILEQLFITFSFIQLTLNLNPKEEKKYTKIERVLWNKRRLKFTKNKKQNGKSLKA